MIKFIDNYYTKLKLLFGRYDSLSDLEKRDLKKFINWYNNLDFYQKRELKKKGDKITKVLIHDIESGNLKKKDIEI